MLNENENFDLTLKNNDAIYVYSRKEIEGDKEYVILTGFVKKPGKYELFETNMTIYDIIFKAGGQTT